VKEKYWEKILEKEKIGERNNKKTWEENFGRDSRRKKDVERKIRKIAL
jgi:hypothetical protein